MNNDKKRALARKLSEVTVAHGATENEERIAKAKIAELDLPPEPKPIPQPSIIDMMAQAQQQYPYQQQMQSPPQFAQALQQAGLGWLAQALFGRGPYPSPY